MSKQNVIERLSPYSGEHELHRQKLVKMLQHLGNLFDFLLFKLLYGF